MHLDNADFWQIEGAGISSSSVMLSMGNSAVGNIIKHIVCVFYLFLNKYNALA